MSLRIANEIDRNHTVEKFVGEKQSRETNQKLLRWKNVHSNTELNFQEFSVTN